MPIVSSRFQVGHAQRGGGRAYVTEWHTDSAGAVHVFEYLSDMRIDHAQAMTARAVALDQVLADSEIDRMMTGWSAGEKLTHQTVPQAAARLRERYRISAGDETLLLAEKIVRFIEDGTFRESDIRAAFGMNAGDWTVFKLKLSGHKNNRDQARSAKGE